MHLKSLVLEILTYIWLTMHTKNVLYFLLLLTKRLGKLNEKRF